MILFQPAYSSSGSEEARAYSSSSGRTAALTPTGHLPAAGRTHPHIHWDNLEASHLVCTSLGCGRKPVPRETHADMGECADSTDAGSGGESFFLVDIAAV